MGVLAMTDIERLALIKAENRRLKGENELLQQRLELWEAQAEELTKKYLLLENQTRGTNR
ncbi:MAG TPA: hypothetical protein VGA08_04025 [Candidatus Saccharimonadales bacterium]